MKTITSKSELTRMITQIIKEELSQEAMNMQGNFQQGQQQGMQKGQAAGQATKQVVQTVANTAKEYVFKFGSIYVSYITFGRQVVWIVGKALFKINVAVHNTIIKVITAALRQAPVMISALSKIAQDKLRAIGIQLQQKYEAAKKILSTLADSTMALFKALVDAAATLKAEVKAIFLVALVELGTLTAPLRGYIKNAWNTVRNVVGVGFDQAVKWGSKQAASWKKWGQGMLNKASNVAGQAYGAAKGFVQSLFEMFERFFSFTSDTHSGIVVEARYISKGILL